jgi:hypothetical protein
LLQQAPSHRQDFLAAPTKTSLARILVKGARQVSGQIRAVQPGKKGKSRKMPSAGRAYAGASSRSASSRAMTPVVQGNTALQAPAMAK